jgi:hypothetical protein
MVEEKDLQVTEPTAEWDDATALKIAKTDHERAANWKQQNQDQKIRRSDEIYGAITKTKFWEGTKIPRASIPIWMGVEQIDSMLPLCVNALFADDPPFEIEPGAGTSIQEAVAVRNLLRNQLANIGIKPNVTLRRIFKRGWKQSFIYGAGIIEYGWELRKDKRSRYMRLPIPQREMVVDPETQQEVAVPNGRFDIRAVQQIDEIPISRPVLSDVDISEFFIDPNCPSTNVQDASFCSTRHFRSINEILKYRNLDGFNIPDFKTLQDVARQKHNTNSDSLKQQAEAVVGNTYQPTIDQSVDPNLSRLEVVRYWQEGRHVWYIPAFTDRPIYNKPNEYEELPFYNIPFIDRPRRFYSYSICDLIDGDVRVMQAIIESRLDELSLMINSPLAIKRGMTFSTSQKRLAPGRMWELDDMEDMPRRVEYGNVSAQAFVEVDSLERRVQKKVGVTDSVGFGVASPGGNSASRTARGVAAQEAAQGGKIQFQVENVEDEVLSPLLQTLLRLNKKFLPALLAEDPNARIPVPGEQGKTLDIDPIDILNASGKFIPRASRKMRIKQALVNGGLEMILGSILNPTLCQMMATQRGMTPNMSAIDTLICDAFNLPPGSFWQMMTDQERQAMQQPSPDQALRAEMQGQREQGTSQRQEASDETKLLIALLTKVLTPDVAHKLIGMDPPAKIAADHAPAPAPAGGKK